MKLLFTTSNDLVPWGGSEELWYQAAACCIEMGHEVAICVEWNPLPSKLQQLIDRLPCYIITKKRQPGAFNRVMPGRFKIYTEKYKDEILNWKPDIAIVSQGNNMDGLNLMEFFLANRIACISIVQAVYEGIWPDTEKATRMAIAYNGTVKNYFVSDANRRMTELMITDKVNNAQVIRNPFNVPYNVMLDFPELRNGYQLACVARYEFYAKGQDALLEVLSNKIWKERDLTINFYGSGKNEQGLRKLIHHFGLKNAVVNKFTPTIDIWKQNHALVLPSRFEGLPLALVEAMLCGRFGIVTDVSGNAEVLEDNISGFLAVAPKPVYINDAMERAWQQKENWEQIGSKAKEYIRKLIPEDPGKFFSQEILAIK